MKGKKAAVAAMSAAMAVGPLAAARGDGYQFVVSGEIVAATTGCSSDSSDATSLTSGTLADGYVCASALEARYRTMGESPTRKLRSDKFKSLIMSFK